MCIIYFPSMLKSSNLAMGMVSTVVFISTLSEVPVILLSRFYMDRFTNRQLLMAVFILLIIQFVVFSFVNSLIIEIIVLFLTKTVATMIFAMLNMKIIATILDYSLQNTGLAIVSTCKSFISIVFQTMAGYLIDYSTFQVFYLVLLLFSVFGFIITLGFKIPTNRKLRMFN